MPNRGERAKLFLPYDSLKGFFEQIHERDKVVVEKIELSDDEKALLDYAFSEVEVGSLIRVVYEDNEQYIQVEGMVSKIDALYAKKICIVKTIIPISKIVALEILSSNKKNTEVVEEL